VNGAAHVSIVGTVTRDPEIRQAGSTNVAGFGIAVNKKYKDKESVSFFDCKAFGKTADVIGQYVKKGSPLYIQGELVQENWTDKQDQKRSKIVVTVNSFTFLPSKKDTTEPKASTEPAAAHYQPVGEEDIPF